MKKIEKSNAITLISLVITIIVLIILASTAIYLSIENSGIFTRVKQAKELYENEQRKEEEELNELYGQLLVASDGTINNISLEKLKEIIQKEISNGTGNPIGTVISYMGNNVPNGYLSCDGEEYNISEYQNLAEQINNEFGKYNYFGGDGTITFAVPDLRGEFLRGTGRATRNTGSGGNVGTHQNGTQHMNLRSFSNSGYSAAYVPYNINANQGGAGADTILQYNSQGEVEVKGGARADIYSLLYYTSRPTNTSVLYCIKY